MAGRLDPAVAETRRAVRHGCGDLEAGQRVVVAVSGGADSMALAAATVFEGRAAGWSVEAVVVDHGLQPGSDSTAALVRGRLAELGCERADVVEVSCGQRGGPEAAARAARYEALEHVATERAAPVLLGHTRDDQAETVVLGLARGSGVRSLSGMPSARGPFRRPLLGITREQTRQACEALGLTVWADPHNSDPRHARVRVRHEVLPVLERQLGPGIAEALVRTADSARLDADALDQLALELETLALAPDGWLRVDVLEPALTALRRRVLRNQAVAAGSPAGDLTAGHVVAMDRLVTDWHGQGPLDLPGGVGLRRRDGRLLFGH